jgi:Skp family chaperone for outer membrane proteins
MVGPYYQTNISSESTLGMNSEDRLEYAKLYFQNAKEIRTTISESYGSLLKDVDEQLSIMEEEIKQIDEKLKSVDDEAERERLTTQRDAAKTYAKPPEEVD